MSLSHAVGVWPSIIAVRGTLAGGLLTFVLQARMAQQSREQALADRNREQRLATAADVPTKLVEYRHAQIARQAHVLRTGERHPALADEVRSTRGAAWSAVFRLELLVENRQLSEAARDVMGRIKALKDIDDANALDPAGDQVRVAIESFVDAARANLIPA